MILSEHRVSTISGGPGVSNGDPSAGLTRSTREGKHSCKRSIWRAGASLLAAAALLIPGGLKGQDCSSMDPADWPNRARPYFLVIVDTSSAMIACTTPPTDWPYKCDAADPAYSLNSCGLNPTRLNDIKCSLTNTITAYAGQVNFGLMTYASGLDSCPAGPCVSEAGEPDGSAHPAGVDNYGCEETPFVDHTTYKNAQNFETTTCGNWPGCQNTGPDGPNFAKGRWLNGGKVVVPLEQDPVWDAAAKSKSNIGELFKWFDGDCTDNKEIFAQGWIPMAGALSSATQYLQAGWSMWSTESYCQEGLSYTYPTALTADDPSCRSVNLLYITAGDPDDCGMDDSLEADGGVRDDWYYAEDATEALFSTGITLGGKNWKVPTHVLTFQGGDNYKTNRIAEKGGTNSVVNISDEISLSQSISNIIAGAIEAEICDNVDNNCNGCVDEGYAHYCNLNPNCCTEDREICLAEYEASIAQNPPDGDLSLLPCVDITDLDQSTSWLCYNPKETCNDIDDNCDGQTDEGMLRCGSDNHCPSIEVCDGIDNDCDGVVDNGIGIGATCANSPSGTPTGICLAGVESCIGGEWVCTGPEPQNEFCDGRDNDCDGETDEAEDLFGVGEPCGNTLGICTPGEYKCICQGENPEDCAIVCDGGTSGSLEQCNGLDDDCDGEVDEELVVGATCANTPTKEAKGACGFGYEECVEGEWVCNANEPTEERCNGVDDDCDGETDESLTVECPSFSLCVQGECEEVCGGEEMGCPLGKSCEEVVTKEGNTTRACVSNVCSASSEDRLPCVDNPWWCDEGQLPPCRCDAVLRQCVGLCHGVSCPEGKTCIPRNGSCQLIGKDCFAAGCGPGERCTGGVCADDPCSDAETRCGDLEYCNEQGECVLPCLNNDCPAGCFEGECVENPCAGVFCNTGWSCDKATGECVKGGPCSATNCRFFEICAEGKCLEDPCWNIHCPNGFRCQNGACYQYSDQGTDDSIDTDSSSDTENDTLSQDNETKLDEVLASGSGGCLCQATPGRTRAHPIWLLTPLLLIGIHLMKRRRLALVIVAVLGIAGCTTESYQFNGAGGNDSEQTDGTEKNPDGGNADTVCDSWAKDDDCDGIDNDCDGLTDEQVDFEKNPFHCGRCGNDCREIYPNSLTRCEEANCVWESCAAFYQNLNGDLKDGCEYYCRQSSILDMCNGVDLGNGSYVGVDDDCDGKTDEDVMLESSLKNCGRCGNVCQFDNAISECNKGNCTLVKCLEGFWNNDSNDDNGCEYACTKQSDKEICNDRDDNCDGQTDEGLTPPSASDVCGTAKIASRPECLSTAQGGVVSIQCKSGAWSCEFPGNVCDPSCGEAPEICDDKDNNCNGKLNEEFPTLGKPCASDDEAPSPGHGACRVNGVIVCEGTSAVRCNASKANCADLEGGCEEKCDGIDNDCDGLTDEYAANKGPQSAHYVRPAVTQVGDSLWMFTYEASRAGATATSAGVGNGFHCAKGECPDGITEPDTGAGAPPLEKIVPCSAENRLPWFNVTPVEAEQSCNAIGGHLCTTEEWKTACKAGVNCAYGYGPRGAECLSEATEGSKFCNLSASYDFVPQTTNVKEDGLLPGGSSKLQSCYADWSGLYSNATNPYIYDLTGNLREITKQGANIYPLMGGAFNSESESGSRCDFSFYVVERGFRLFDTGFRCCFSKDPLN